ncbi:hypothetical protein C7974DRAFT_420313 [Boeremia exigua]|uniref:uncharacterized protein n=1 Tax=Boeremia exigua TaxID=749465 RepID=UPI001E8E333C|nr:uncharacterized protein C7974DRAFT_420313 [Boeremia exigua]KAH6641939.1 hypothetical protein C7974DRAFT_420313 [Boeremia exigua]
MGDSTILVSNGTCYSSVGNKLDGSFIPCGNDAFGHQTCCGAGDNCLADNACFGVHGSGYGSFLTYMAGCTDPEYTDARCPDKHGIDQPWIALTLCDNSDGEWAPCSQKDDPTTLQPGSFCSCTDAAKTTVAFSDADSLAQFASLPQSTGQSIVFQAGHSPSGDPTPLASSDPSPTGNSNQPTGASGLTSAAPAPFSSNGTPTQTGSNLPSRGTGTATDAANTGAATSSSTSRGPSSTPDSSSSGLASRAKIGIGVGVGAVALVLIALLAFICLRRRKRKQPNPSVVESAGIHDDEKRPGPLTTPPMPEIAGQPLSEADGRAAKPWNVRSELQCTNYFSAAGIDAQEPTGMRARPHEVPQQYVAYRPPPPPRLQEQGAVAELPAVKTPPEEREGRW